MPAGRGCRSARRRSSRAHVRRGRHPSPHLTSWLSFIRRLIASPSCASKPRAGAGEMSADRLPRGSGSPASATDCLNQNIISTNASLHQCIKPGSAQTSFAARPAGQGRPCPAPPAGTRSQRPAGGVSRVHSSAGIVHAGFCPSTAQELQGHLASTNQAPYRLVIPRGGPHLKDGVACQALPHCRCLRLRRCHLRQGRDARRAPM